MEIRDQPDSPDPPVIAEEDKSGTEDLVDLNSIPVQDRREVDFQPDLIDRPVEIQPDFFRNLSALTPGVEAALKTLMEEASRKETLLAQIKELMVWDTLSEEIRNLFPEEYMKELINWIMKSMQSEVVRQGILDQNRKELEYHKKRENLVHDQQREMSLMKKRHQEALLDCDMKNTPHRKPIVTKSNEEEMHKLVLKQEDELNSFDRKIVNAIDNILTAQQKKFREIGIPGMKETIKSEEILQQMIVIDVVARLSGVDMQVL